MEDRFEDLPETFNQMMLLPNMPDFRTSHRLLTEIHQIVAASCAFLKKEENQRPKGWAVPPDSTRGHVNPPCRIIQHEFFFPCRSCLLLLVNRKSIMAFSCNDDFGKSSMMQPCSQRL
jgi:hypothetical protein